MQIYSQPTTTVEFNRIRHSRQLNFETCCPCPDNTNKYADLRNPEEFQIRNGNGIPNEEDVGDFSGSNNLDDYPYPSLSADTEGSSSIFFPTSVRANGPSTRYKISKMQIQ